MYVFKGQDGLPAPRPKPQPQQQPDDGAAFWTFVQRASLVVGLVVGLRSPTRGALTGSPKNSTAVALIDPYISVDKRIWVLNFQIG